jgi:hypothetical protein
MKIDRKWVLASAMAVAMLGVIGLLVMASHWLDGSGTSSGVSLPLLVVIGVASLLACLAFLAISFAVLNLDDPKQPLGLPEGSVRAVIALSLIMIFAVVTIFFYVNLAQGDVIATAPLAPKELESFQSGPFKEYIVTSRDVPPVSPTAGAPIGNEKKTIVYYRRGGSANDFAKQVFTMLGTLMAAISSFYFGSSVAASSSATARASETDPLLLDVRPNTARAGDQPPLTISGKNLSQVKEVRLVKGSDQISTSGLKTQPTVVECLLDKPLTEGSWDLTVSTSDGRTATRTGALTVSAAAMPVAAG